MNDSASILATFATIKSLYNAGSYINPYQLLNEFVADIIRVEKLYSFSPADMVHRLKANFGFDIPEAIVRSASKKLPGAKLREGTIFIDCDTLNGDETFKQEHDAAEQDYKLIHDELHSFVKEADGNEVDSKELATELMAFLLDDDDHESHNPHYRELVRLFVLKNEDNEAIVRILDSIREGSILYVGLANNIVETGSIKQKLTLFLDVEVLFDLYGLNGPIHQTLANDFFSQVRAANTGEQKIRLRYFSETKHEINRYFANAEDVVRGAPLDPGKPAMRNIVNGCSDAGDIVGKQSDFYYRLKSRYGIIEDENTDYYSLQDEEFNLEDRNTIGIKPDDLKFISHINKLRRGCNKKALLDSGFLIVTNTQSLLNASREKIAELNNAETSDARFGFAVHANHITNLLWFKLGGSFGRGQLPRNVSAAYKTRVALSHEIAQNASKEFDAAKKQFDNGDLTREQLLNRIITLRSKPITPDAIEAESIATDMDFSPDYLNRIEAEYAASKDIISKRDEEISNLKRQQESAIAKKDAELAMKDSSVEQTKRENEALRSRLESYTKMEREKAARADRRKRIALKTRSYIWKLLLTAAVCIVIVSIIRFLSPDESMTASTIIGIVIGIIGIGVTIHLSKGDKKQEGNQ